MAEGKATKARFFERMLLVASNAPPEGDDWDYELTNNSPHDIILRMARKASRIDPMFALRMNEGRLALAPQTAAPEPESQVLRMIKKR